MKFIFQFREKNEKNVNSKKTKKVHSECFSNFQVMLRQPGTDEKKV
jgi:hypothetical protein